MHLNEISDDADFNKTVQAKAVLAKVKLSAQPEILIELNRLVNQEDVDFEQIANLISKDVGMSAKMLKLASSPIYARGRTYCSVYEALMTIGFEEFQIYFRTATLHDFLNKACYPYRGFNEHSQRIAMFSKLLAEEFMPRIANDAYTLGLFHDVGAVLIPLHTESYSEHIHRVLPLHYGITEMEYNVVQTNHCAVGEMFARSWGISTEILTAMRYHHRSKMDPIWTRKAINLIHILQLAESINDSMQSKDFDEKHIPKHNENTDRIFEFFDLSDADMEDLVQQLSEALEAEKQTSTSAA